MIADLSQKRTIESLPNAFLIGIQKAGTSALFDWLGQHPDIFAPVSGKDFHFFSRDDFFDKGLPCLQERYDGFDGQKIVMNAGVNYVFHRHAAQRMHHYYPEAKYMVVLRDPAKRAWSAYHFMHKMGYETSSNFEEAIANELGNKLDNSNTTQSNLTYLAHGLYFEQLRDFFSVVPREQVMVLIYEEMMADKDTALKAIFDFLGVDNNFKPTYKSVNVTGQAKSVALNRMINTDSWWKRALKNLGITKLISVNIRSNIRRFIREKNTTPTKAEKMPQDTYENISRHFDEDITKLSELLGRDMKAVWK